MVMTAMTTRSSTSVKPRRRDDRPAHAQSVAAVLLARGNEDTIPRPKGRVKRNGPASAGVGPLAYRACVGWNVSWHVPPRGGWSTTPHSAPSREEIARRGQQYHDELLRAELEPEHKGKLLVLEVETGTTRWPAGWRRLTGWNVLGIVVGGFGVVIGLWQPKTHGWPLTDGAACRSKGNLMELSESEWRVVRALADGERRGLSRAFGLMLVWVAGLGLLGLCAWEGVAVARGARAEKLTLDHVVLPRFDGATPPQAARKHTVLVALIARSALALVYFFIGAFLVSLGVAQRHYGRQDAITAKLARRLRELGQLDEPAPPKEQPS